MQRRRYVAMSLIAIAVIFLLSPIASASTITGTVTDVESGEALPFVSVLIDGDTPGGLNIRRGVMGDDVGAYLLPNIPAGTYRIRFLYVGYRELADTLQIDDDVTVTYDAKLVPEPIEAPEVVVEADRFSREQDVQTGFINLDVKTLEELPSIGEADPIRSLQLLPGVQAASDVSSGLYIRGGGPDQTLILLDDVTVYNPTHAFGFFSTFNSEAVSGVNLYKGAYPAQHGGRLGSVLEVNSRPAEAPKLTGSGGVSTIAARLMMQGPVGENRWLIAARRTYLEPFLAVLRRSNDQIPKYNFYDVNGKFTTRKGGAGWAELKAYRGRDNLDIDLDEGTGIDLSWGNTVLSAKYNRLLGESLLGSAQLSWSEYSSLAVASALNTPFAIDNHIRDTSFRATLDWRPNPSHRLSTGVHAARYDMLYDSEFNADQGIDFQARPFELSAFVDEQWTPRTGTSLRGGVRGRYISDGDRFLVEPRLALSQLVREVRLKAGAGFYNQFVQLVSTEGFSAADFYVPIDETTRPGQSWQVVLGAEWEASPRYQYTIEGYYTGLSNLVLLDTNNAADQRSTATTDIFNTGGDGYATGVELFAQRRTGNLTGWIGYTLGWTRRQFDAVNSGERFPPKYDRRHDLSFVGNYRRGKWSYGAALIYATGQAFTPASALYQLRIPGTNTEAKRTLAASRNSARLLPYHRLDVGVTRDFEAFGTSAQWEIQVFNLYSRRNEWFIQYDSDTGEADVVRQLPIIPSLGVNFKF